MLVWGLCEICVGFVWGRVELCGICGNDWECLCGICVGFVWECVGLCGICLGLCGNFGKNDWK